MTAGAPFDQLHATVSERLSDDGQRYTSQRRRLVEILARAGSPLSIPESFSRSPTDDPPAGGGVARRVPTAN